MGQYYNLCRFITENDSSSIMTILALFVILLHLNGFAMCDDTKRLVLHSDLDIQAALDELRHEINATKQENLALNTKILALNTKIDELEKHHGSTYVRWGRTVCPGNGTEKVYSGFTAGSYFNTEGGAASSICLPETPSWAYYVDGLQNIGGYVYGSEYESAAMDQHAFGKTMQEQDVPCAVCHSVRAATIMIPGSTSCNSGWTHEYTGYLMTGYHASKGGTDYACVDKSPEAVYHGEANLNGHLFYFAEVHCGALPCQEYPEGRELACVVCSK